jgi:hypothetical protein
MARNLARHKVEGTGRFQRRHRTVAQAMEGNLGCFTRLVAAFRTNKRFPVALTSFCSRMPLQSIHPFHG